MKAVHKNRIIQGLKNSAGIQEEQIMIAKQRDPRDAKISGLIEQQAAYIEAANFIQDNLETEG